MQDNETETLADRLNQEPVIFRGSTNSELGIILLCAVVFWVPFGFIVGALLGAVVMGLGISSLGVLITIVVGSTVFQRTKRGKPDNYYQHQVIIKLDQLKLRKSSLVLTSGNWDLGRTELHKMNQSTS